MLNAAPICTLKFVLGFLKFLHRFLSKHKKWSPIPKRNGDQIGQAACCMSDGVGLLACSLQASSHSLRFCSRSKSRAMAYSCARKKLGCGVMSGADDATASSTYRKYSSKHVWYCCMSRAISLVRLSCDMVFSQRLSCSHCTMYLRRPEQRVKLQYNKYRQIAKVVSRRTLIPHKC